MTNLGAAERRRYSRHLLLPEIGTEGQSRLKGARVLVVGAGGLGCPAALYLAAAGVGTLGLLDCDSVDESNLQRQILFGSQDIGAPKAERARERLLQLNPEIQLLAHAVELCAANVGEIFAGYELIVDGSDRVATRYLVNDASVIYRKSLVSAAIYRFEGQAMSYAPDRGPCYRCLFPQPSEGVVPNCEQAGVLGVLPGVLGAIQATETIKLLLGIGDPLLGRLLTYDALSLSFHEFRIARRADCAVCGEHPSITRPQDPPGFCTVEEQRRVRRISAQELAAQLGRSEVTLIDVREPDEFARGHLPRAINLPLTQIEQQGLGLPHEATTIFMCRSGVRSLKACALARRAGLREPLQLEGGLLAWKAAVEPSFHV
jgi:sulfur-carrier protein adenylyltransferase/sulfurtransferase